MDKPIFSLMPVNSSNGAPMGRREYGHSELQEATTLFVALIPLDDGYDAAGAYWGHGAPLYAVFSEDPEICIYVRGREKLTAEHIGANPSVALIPTESDTYMLWADAMGYDIVPHFAGYQWVARFETVESGEFDTMQECYEHLQDYTLGLDDVD